MTLELLQLKDFQRHRRRDVTLDPAVTTIVGPSDAGKSSLLRALRWLAVNRPLGEGFVRDGAEGAAVRARLDGHVVERRRRGQDNSYRLDGRALRSFGGDVPRAVVDLLRMDELNFQRQHDPPFWFSLTPGEVARQLNAIVDLELIDRVAADLASRLRRAAAEAEVTAGRLKEAEGRRDALAFASDADGELWRVEGLERRAREAGKLAEGLAAIVGEALECRGDLGRKRDLGLLGENAVRQGDRALSLGRIEEALRRLIADARVAEAAAGRELPDLCGLDCLGDRFGGLSDRAGRLGGLCGEIRGQAQSAADAYNRLKEAERALSEECGGVCPVCGGPMR